MLSNIRAIFIAALMLSTANTFAVGFNHETIIHFHNCTSQPLTVTWESFNFSFDSDAESKIHHGEFSIDSDEKSENIKALRAFFNTCPNGIVTCKIKGSGVNESFSVKLSGVLPEGRLVYFENTESISFAKSHIEFANVSAINTVHIGC